MQQLPLLLRLSKQLLLQRLSLPRQAQAKPQQKSLLMMRLLKLSPAKLPLQTLKKM